MQAAQTDDVLIAVATAVHAEGRSSLEHSTVPRTADPCIPTRVNLLARNFSKPSPSRRPALPLLARLGPHAGAGPGDDALVLPQQFTALSSAPYRQFAGVDGGLHDAPQLALVGRSRESDTARPTPPKAGDLSGHPDGTPIIVRRERPHPGAQLSLFDLDEGMPHQVFLTDTPIAGGGSIQHLEVRHRAHAGAEGRPGPAPCCWTVNWSPQSPHAMGVP